MADFTTPFANEAEKRLPDAGEKTTGFPCGPAEKALFNMLFHRLEAEIGEVISFAGIPFDDEDNTLLRQAIEAIFASLSGEGDTEGFVLFTQARARLPIFPDIQSANGTMTVTSPAPGTVRIPSGVTFQHRGIFPVTTTETDLSTDASKIYHARWNPTDGYSLKDLASGTYNPGTLAESDAAFDSTYDDMLIARVVTNSSNVATITNLVNLADLKKRDYVSGAGSYNGGNDRVIYTGNFTLNWARTPECIFSGTILPVGPSGGLSLQGWVNNIDAFSVNRYAQSASVRADFWQNTVATPSGNMQMLAIA